MAQERVGLDAVPGWLAAAPPRLLTRGARERAPPRQVTLLLCDGTGRLLGTLPPFEVTCRGGRRWATWCPAPGLHGVDVTVLRLLATEPWRGPPGGR